MNVGKFASLTAGLLVRKGEARPSVISGGPVVNFPSPERRQEGQSSHGQVSHGRKPASTRKTASANPSPPQPREPTVKPRRLMVTLTPLEFETLGHMSVKRGTSRHQLVRNALDEYMSLLGEEYAEDCHCIYTGCTCK